MVETVLDTLKKVHESLDHPSYLEDVEKKVKTIAKQQQNKMTRLQAKLEEQQKLKQRALEKFIGDEISKADYDNFIGTIDERIIESQDLKMTVQQNDKDLSDIKTNLKKAIKLKTLSKEILNRFVRKVEVTEDRDVKLTLNFQDVVVF